MENNKPISEWTLDEAQAECDAHNDDCNGCKLMGVTCDLAAIRAPYNWGLEEKRDEAVATDTDAACKPRLAEVLGVEVGERFRISLNGGTLTFWVTEKGYFKTDPPEQVGSTYMLLDAINHPESIIRAPRLTEAELAICKAVGAKWVSKNKYGARRVTLWDGKPIFDEGMFSIPEDDEHSVTIGVIGRISDVLFPSVKPGDCIEVEAQNAKVQ